MLSMYGQDKLGVVKLIVQQTGTYGQQFRRPYMANTTGAVVQAVVEEALQSNKLMPASFAINGQASFISQRAEPESIIPIANGWNVERLRFVLELMRSDNMGTRHRIFVSGYTEYSDLSLQGSIDPRMKFFINSITTSKVHDVRTPVGMQTYNKVIDTSQILVNRDYVGVGTAAPALSLAPENVFSNWENMDMRTHNPDAMMLDLRQNLTGQPTKNKRENAIAPQNSSTILNTYLQTRRGNPEMTQDELLTQCGRMVRGTPAAEDAFIGFLMIRRRQMGHSYLSLFDNTFTMDDLLALDPNTPAVTTPVMFTDGLHRTGLTADWGASDLPTQTAAMLAQSLPSYMALQCFSFISIKSTNMHTVGGQIVSVVDGVQGFGGGNQAAEIEAFIFRINQELMTGLTHGNQIPYMLDAKVDTLGETWIEISINGEPPAMYVAPTFSDALATPVVTTNSQVLEGITWGANQIADTIWENDSQGMRSNSLSGDIYI